MERDWVVGETGFFGNEPAEGEGGCCELEGVWVRVGAGEMTTPEGEAGGNVDGLGSGARVGGSAEGERIRAFWVPLEMPDGRRGEDTGFGREKPAEGLLPWVCDAPGAGGTSAVLSPGWRAAEGAGGTKWASVGESGLSVEEFFRRPGAGWEANGGAGGVVGGSVRPGASPDAGRAAEGGNPEGRAVLTGRSVGDGWVLRWRSHS